MPFGQWAHNLWLLDNEARVCALNLEVFGNEFVNKTSSAPWVGAFNTLLLAQLVEENSCFFGM
jgi:hypothetical protein